MTKDEMKQTVTACLEAWTSGDFEQARDLMADDVTFDGPFGHTEGADAYIDGVRQFARNIERIDIDKVIAERGEVCVMYDLVSKQSGAIPTVGWYKTRNGKVTAVRAFFDARRLMAAAAS